MSEKKYCEDSLKCEKFKREVCWYGDYADICGQAPRPQDPLGSAGLALLYRLLRIGEVVTKGDEHLMDDCINWEPVNRWAIGTKYSEIMQPIRRAV